MRTEGERPPSSLKLDHRLLPAVHETLGDQHHMPIFLRTFDKPLLLLSRGSFGPQFFYHFPPFCLSVTLFSHTKNSGDLCKVTIPCK